jgi:hypothetical protein
MTADPFTSFLLLADAKEGMTTFTARANASTRQEWVLGPIPSAETARIAGHLVYFAKDGYAHKLLKLQEHPDGIPHTEAQLSCSMEDLANLGFQAS